MKVKTEYLIVSDYAFTDSNGKQCINGIFQKIFKIKDNFNQIQTLFVSSSLTSDTAPKLIEVEIIGPDKTMIASAKLERKSEALFENRIGFICKFNVPIRKLGSYYINIFFDKKLICNNGNLFDVIEKE